MIKIYGRGAAVYIENANGAQHLFSLQAVIDSNGTSLSIKDIPKAIEIVSGVNHDVFVKEDDTPYTGTPTQICDQLNAVFNATGSHDGEPPVITSNLSIASVESHTINYELTANFGVGYEWANLPEGVTTVNGNVRKLIGGANLSSGVYVITARAINLFGFDEKDITLTISDPPFADTKSIEFQNNDYMGANAALVEPVFGRTGNGSGVNDAWKLSLKFKAGTASNQNQTIFYFGAQDVANGGQIQLKFDGSALRKCLVLRYGSNNNRLELRTPDFSVPVSGWISVIVDYDGGTTGSASNEVSDYYSRFKIAIENVDQALTGTHQNFGYSGQIEGVNYRIGRWNNGQSLRNGCKVNEIAAWSGAQMPTNSEIYNSGVNFDFSTLTDSPLHWYRCGDDDNYPIITDVIGNAHFQMYNMTAASIVNDV